MPARLPLELVIYTTKFLDAPSLFRTMLAVRPVFGYYTSKRVHWNKVRDRLAGHGELKLGPFDARTAFWRLTHDPMGRVIEYPPESVDARVEFAVRVLSGAGDVDPQLVLRFLETPYQGRLERLVHVFIGLGRPLTRDRLAAFSRLDRAEILYRTHGVSALDADELYDLNRDRMAVSCLNSISEKLIEGVLARYKKELPTSKRAKHLLSRLPGDPDLFRAYATARGKGKAALANTVARRIAYGWKKRLRASMWHRHQVEQRIEDERRQLADIISAAGTPRIKAREILGV